MRFEPPTIKERGQVVAAMTAVQQHKPAHGEASGRIRCPRCGAGLQFVVMASGLSRGHCAAACGIRWCQ
jgi:ribosomal protein S27AE